MSNPAPLSLSFTSGKQLLVSNHEKWVLVWLASHMLPYVT